MTYLYNFFSALIFTVIIETITLFLLFRYYFKDKENSRGKVIFSGFFASFATIPYVWFIFPILIARSYDLYLLTAESFAFMVEAVFYRQVLKISWARAFLASFICNLISCLLGIFLQSQGLWFHW
jgi:hypothetical protein